MIAICPECSKKYRLPDEKIGIKFRCKKCSGVVDTSLESNREQASQSVATAPTPTVISEQAAEKFKQRFERRREVIKRLRDSARAIKSGMRTLVPPPQVAAKVSAPQAAPEPTPEIPSDAPAVSPAEQPFIHDPEAATVVATPPAIPERDIETVAITAQPVLSDTPAEPTAPIAPAVAVEDDDDENIVDLDADISAAEDLSVEPVLRTNEATLAVESTDALEATEATAEADEFMPGDEPETSVAEVPVEAAAAEADGSADEFMLGDKPEPPVAVAVVEDDESDEDEDLFASYDDDADSSGVTPEKAEASLPVAESVPEVAAELSAEPKPKPETAEEEVAAEVPDAVDDADDELMPSDEPELPASTAPAASAKVADTESAAADDDTDDEADLFASYDDAESTTPAEVPDEKKVAPEPEPSTPLLPVEEMDESAGVEADFDLAAENLLATEIAAEDTADKDEAKEVVDTAAPAVDDVTASESELTQPAALDTAIAADAPPPVAEPAPTEAVPVAKLADGAIDLAAVSLGEPGADEELLRVELLPDFSSLPSVTPPDNFAVQPDADGFYSEDALTFSAPDPDLDKDLEVAELLPLDFAVPQDVAEMDSEDEEDRSLKAFCDECLARYRLPQTYIERTKLKCAKCQGAVIVLDMDEDYPADVLADAESPDDDVDTADNDEDDDYPDAAEDLPSALVPDVEGADEEELDDIDLEADLAALASNDDEDTADEEIALAAESSAADADSEQDELNDLDDFNEDIDLDADMDIDLDANAVEGAAKKK